METPKTEQIPPVLPNHPVHDGGSPFSSQLLEKARADAGTVLKELGTQASGLSAAEAESRLKQYGPNEIAREKHQSAGMRLLGNVKNPLVILLFALRVISCLTGDPSEKVLEFGYLNSYHHTGLKNLRDSGISVHS